MAQTDELFELIHSLSPTEKRYFKLHADSYSYGGYKKQYEKLYDAINNWPEEAYDEKEFRKKNKGKTFLKNLPADKAYLRDLILKVMRNYNSDLDPRIQLSEMMMSMHILINKGLKAQAYKMIEKGLKLAEQTQQFNEMLSIHDHMINLHRMSPGDSQYKAAEIKKMETSVMDRIMSTREAVYIRSAMAEIQTRSEWKERKRKYKTY